VGGPWFSVSSITGTPGDPGVVTPLSSTPGGATVWVNPAPSLGDVSLTTTVEYTNDPVTGVVEVCKRADANSTSETGTYTFKITSEDPGINVLNSSTGAYDQMWSTTASATISAGGLGCSGPILVPAGVIQTVEQGTPYVTTITALLDDGTTNELVGAPSSNDPTGPSTSYERVLAGDTTDQTVVTYTDRLSTVKLCKEWTGRTSVPTTSFPFTLSSSGPAGPTAVTGTVGLTAGNCQIVGTVRAGTVVNITEGVVPGTKVASISVSPTANAVPLSLSTANRTVSVVAGPGETDVTYTDQKAADGTLKICVAPTTNPTAGTVPFTVNGTQTIDVNLSGTAVQCTIDPTTQAFNGSVTISGGALPPPDAFTGTPTVAPTNVEVFEGGVLTATNQLSLGAHTASSATVLMSEGIVTEVTFTVDPPAPVTAPPVTSVEQVTAGGGIILVPTTSPTEVPVVTAPIKPATTTISRDIAKFERQIASVNKQIRVVQRQLSSHHHLTTAVQRADVRKLAALHTRERMLVRELAQERTLLRKLK
jgi:hypothetical protein